MSASAPLALVEPWTDYEGAGGARIGFLPLPTAATHELGLDGTDQLDLVWPASLPALALVTRGVVLRAVYADGSNTEHEVIDLERTAGAEATVHVRCVGPLDRLRRVPVRLTDADGVVYYDVPLVGLAPSTILATILGEAPPWLVPGTVTPTDLEELQFTHATARSALQQLADQVGYEVQLRRVSAVQYAVDLVLIGNGAVGPRICPGATLVRQSRRIGAGDSQVTLGRYAGPDGDDRSTTLGWTWWSVTAVSGAVIQLGPLHTAGGGPVGFDGQGTDVRVPTQLLNPDPAAATAVNTPLLTREVFRSVLAGYTLHRLRDDDGGLFEYYSWSTVPTLGGDLGVYAIVRKDNVAPPATFSALEWIDQTAGGTYRGALRIAFDGSGVPTLTPLNGATNAGARHLGDGVYQVWCQLTGVVAGNELRFRVVPAADGASATGAIQYADAVIGDRAAIPALKRPWYVEKANGTVAAVLATSATTQELTLAVGGSLTVGDRVRLVADGARRHLTELEAPAELVLHGEHPGLYEGPWDDTLNEVPNAIFLAYSNPSARPDGFGGSAGTWAREAGVGNVLTGSYSARYSVTTGAEAVLLSRSWSTRIQARKSTYSATLYLRPLSQTNGVLSFQLTVNGQRVGEAVTYRAPVNQWRNDIRIEGLDLSAYIDTTITVGFELRATPDPSATFVGSGLVDAVAVGPSLTARPIVLGSQPARAWQAVNAWLDERRTLPVAVDLEAAELVSLGVATTPIPLGGLLPIEQDGALESLRVRRLRRDLVAGILTTVQLSNEPPRLRRRLREAPVPTIPFFEPVQVQAATRDTRQAVQTLTAAVTATTETTVTITLTHSHLQGGVATIVYSSFGATYVSGSGLGPYVFARPGPGTLVGAVIFTARLPGHSDVIASVEVPAQDAVYRPSVREQITETDTQGTLTVVIADDPESRVTGVEFATQQGNGAMSSFTLDSSVPYSQSVFFVEKQPAKIAYRVIGKNSAGTTGQVLAEAIVTLKPANKPAAPNLNADCTSKSGDVVLRGEGDADTLSMRYAYSTSAMPSDGTVDAASPVNGRAFNATLTAVLASIDATLYVKARAYSATGGGGVGSEYAQLTIRRDSKDFDKWLVIHFAEFIPQQNTYGDWGIGAGGLGLAANSVDRYAYAPVVLPPGAVIKELHVHGWRQTGTATSEIKLQKLFGSAIVDAVTDVATATISSGDNTNYQTVSVTGLSETVPTSGDMRYGLQFRGHRTASPGVGVGQVKIKYNSPGYEVTL